ncbi:LacI family DNA-binding transcriptional regulator [Leucobacter sp. NPDC015123]|uniref:LacI family DNA-binding transcriptional regulator n=1 Tax=Leucobacter sp. NPDC015123 TaxID=3364129 RepID=UPI0036F48FA9
MGSSSRRPTLADVAAKAGTSTAVVSYVVNNGPRAVAPATRERVEKAIGELGYRRNPIAGALSAGRSNLVGLIVPDTANGFFGELSRCFEAEGRKRGFLTMLGNTGYDGEISAHYISGFSDLRARGIFTMSVAQGDEIPSDVPFVFIHSVPEGVTAPSVRFDDHAGAKLAVEHLIGHGFTDILCLAGTHAGDPASLRVQGWEQAMAEAGLPTEGRVYRSSFDRVQVEADVREILEGGEWPEAIFATTDEQALAVLRAAAAVGARIPEDLALVGFDGIREALLGRVRLTTVRVPMEQLAERAFDMLEEIGAAAQSGGDSPGPLGAHLVFAGELVVGETCGCPTSGTAIGEA